MKKTILLSLIFSLNVCPQKAFADYSRAITVSAEISLIAAGIITSVICNKKIKSYKEKLEVIRELKDYLKLKENDEITYELLLSRKTAAFLERIDQAGILKEIIENKYTEKKLINKIWWGKFGFWSGFVVTGTATFALLVTVIKIIKDHIRKKEEERKKKIEHEKKRLEEERKRKLEAEKEAREAEERERIKAEKIRLEKERKIKQKQIEEAEKERKRIEEEERKKEEEKQRKIEDEKKRLEEERKRKLEAEKVKAKIDKITKKKKSGISKFKKDSHKHKKKPKNVFENTFMLKLFFKTVNLLKKRLKEFLSKKGNRSCHKKTESTYLTIDKLMKEGYVPLPYSPESIEPTKYKGLDPEKDSELLKALAESKLTQFYKDVRRGKHTKSESILSSYAYRIAFDEPQKDNSESDEESEVDTDSLQYSSDSDELNFEEISSESDYESDEDSDLELDPEIDLENLTAAFGSENVVFDKIRKATKNHNFHDLLTAIEKHCNENNMDPDRLKDIIANRLATDLEKTIKDSYRSSLNHAEDKKKLEIDTSFKEATMNFEGEEHPAIKVFYEETNKNGKVEKLSKKIRLSTSSILNSLPPEIRKNLDE